MIDVNALTFDGDGTPEKQVLRNGQSPQGKGLRLRWTHDR